MRSFLRLSHQRETGRKLIGTVHFVRVVVLNIDASKSNIQAI